jgi:hypothetical protein
MTTELHRCDEVIVPYSALEAYGAKLRTGERTDWPVTDNDCRALLEQAVHDLIVLRDGSENDPGSKLSVLESLRLAAEDWIPEIVFEARVAHDYSWDRVATRLGLFSALAARRRYGFYERVHPDLR